MRRIDEIVIHYTATPAGRDVTAAEIDGWHRARGWAGIGYHFVVRLDGTIERGRSVGAAGAHARGHNATTIGVCYVGGGTGQDTRTPAQRRALRLLVGGLRDVFGPLGVAGHRDLGATLCPGFDVRAETWPLSLGEAAP